MKRALGRLQRDFNIINKTGRGGAVTDGAAVQGWWWRKGGVELNGKTRTATSKRNPKAFDEHSPCLSNGPLMCSARKRCCVYCRRGGAAACARAGKPKNVTTLVSDDTIAEHGSLPGLANGGRRRHDRFSGT